MAAEELSAAVARITQLEAALLQTRAVVEARAGAGVAAATDAQRSLVDTRVLGKPRNFDGKEANWKSSRFTFLG